MELRVEGLVVRIGDRSIVDKVTIEVPSGSVVGLLGPNGAGKTTMLRSLYRALRPTAGVVTIDEADLWRMSAREAARQVAAMTQDHPVEFEFSAREIVRLGRLPHKRLLDRRSRRDDDIVEHAAALAQASHLMDRMFSTLSGGERQRVLLARALTKEPQLLVLDEPTNHLDIGGQLDLLQLIRATGVTVVAALHDLNLAAAICDQVVLLKEGRVAAAGAPADVLTSELLAAVYGVRAHCGVHPLTGRILLAFDVLTDRAPAQA
jgi:iron complex transport system ATP-binding protein